MCTTIVVGKKATVDGSVIVAHSDDDVADERLIFVPASERPGSFRNVYYDDAALGHDMKDPASGRTYNASELYRYIGSDRGPGYELPKGEEASEGLYSSIPLGQIEQVSSTFAYFDSNYGVMNERQLMIGECTCGAKVHPLPEPGKRLLYSAELSRIALERCSSAREAVILIGRLIMEHGYYGTGETLLVGDPNEAWVMEMCGYDMDGTDGLWVAQRVPDNGFFVAANQFRIRDIDPAAPHDGETLMYSENLFEVCSQLGWWDPSESETLDWASTVSYGEYSHPYYSLRRVWRALLKARPSANLPAWVEDGYTRAYPFTVAPDTKMSVADVAEVYRDHYEGTELDMTQDPAAGPWGDPTRYENNPDKGNAFELSLYRPRGAWERPISIYRSGMHWINQARAGLPDALGGVAWIGLDRPAASCLIPFFVGVTGLPACMETMNLLDLDFDSAWWAFNVVANLATLKYSYMIEEIIQRRGKLEQEAFDLVARYTAAARDSGQDPDRADLTEVCSTHAARIRKQWWKLAKHLMVKYNDGCISTERAIMQKVDYPECWLDDVGYFDGPTSYRQR